MIKQKKKILENYLIQLQRNSFHLYGMPHLKLHFVLFSTKRIYNVLSGKLKEWNWAINKMLLLIRKRWFMFLFCFALFWLCLSCDINSNEFKESKKQFIKQWQYRKTIITICVNRVANEAYTWNCVPAIVLLFAHLVANQTLQHIHTLCHIMHSHLKAFNSIEPICGCYYPRNDSIARDYFITIQIIQKSVVTSAFHLPHFISVIVPILITFHTRA